MDTRTSGSDLWSIASADVEQETEERLFTALRVEASQYWPVLASAQTDEDFNTRMAVLADSLNSVTASVLDEDTEGYFATLRTRLDDAFANDFGLVQGRRTARRQAHFAELRREVVAEIRKEADDVIDTVPSEGFLGGPEVGATGPTSSEQTPGSGAPDNASGINPTLDHSEGPNILPDEDVVNSVTGMKEFVTAEQHLAVVEFQRRHYNHIADAIKTAPVDAETRERLARHFADHLTGTNENFNRDRFIGASTHTASRLDFKQADTLTADGLEEWLKNNGGDNPKWAEGDGREEASMVKVWTGDPMSSYNNAPKKEASSDLTDDDLRQLATQGNELAESMLHIREGRD